MLMNMITPTIWYFTELHILVWESGLSCISLIFPCPSLHWHALWFSNRSLLARCFPAVIFIMSPCTFNFCSSFKHDLNLIITGLHMCVTVMCKSSSFCTVGHLCRYHWTGSSCPCTMLCMSAVLSFFFWQPLYFDCCLWTGYVYINP